jgi:hypothetical protein
MAGVSEDIAGVRLEQSGLQLLDGMLAERHPSVDIGPFFRRYPQIPCHASKTGTQQSGLHTSKSTAS